MKLKALKELRYATRRLLAGDPFEAPPKDARILIAIKKAAPDDGKTVEQKPKKDKKKQEAPVVELPPLVDVVAEVVDVEEGSESE